jgi:hypothetical protein
LRERVRNVYEERGVLEAVSKRSYQRTKIHVVVPAVDSDEAGLLEVLESDLEDFFFGVPVLVESESENAKIKRAPI